MISIRLHAHPPPASWICACALMRDGGHYSHTVHAVSLLDSTSAPTAALTEPGPATPLDKY